MEIVKRIGGYLLIIGAVILAIAMVVTLPKRIMESIYIIQKDSVSGMGYFTGTILVNLLFVLIILFMRKRGLKLLQNPKKENNKDKVTR